MIEDRMINVLLVEDDIVDVKYMQTEFIQYGIKNRLTLAGNGVEALDKLYGRNDEPRINPNIIILDVSMPKMGGLEFLQNLRADPRFAKLPVFLLSSSNAERDITAALKLGVAGYFIKPLDFEVFLPAYMKVLEKI